MTDHQTTEARFASSPRPAPQVFVPEAAADAAYQVWSFIYLSIIRPVGLMDLVMSSGARAVQLQCQNIAEGAHYANFSGNG